MGIFLLSPTGCIISQNKIFLFGRKKSLFYVYLIVDVINKLFTLIANLVFINTGEQQWSSGNVFK